MNLLERIRRLEEQVRANRISDGSGYRRRVSAGGTSLEIDLSGGGGAAVTRYRLKGIEADRLACVTWDGTTEGTTTVYLAKPFKLREAVTTETIEGVRYNYTYTTGPDSLNKYRIAKIQGQTAEYERCVVTPEWLLNDEIFAISGSTGISNTTLMDLNLDARAWAVHA